MCFKYPLLYLILSNELGVLFRPEPHGLNIVLQLLNPLPQPLCLFSFLGGSFELALKQTLFLLLNEEIYFVDFILNKALNLVKLGKIRLDDPNFILNYLELRAHSLEICCQCFS
jgi:hypothetical protein